MRTLISAGLLLLTATAASAGPQEEAEVKAMHWVPATHMPLAASRSTIIELPGFMAIEGSEAARFRQIVDGKSPPGLELDTLNTKTGSEIIFSWHPSGYVRSDDWADVDADNFLRQIKERDIEANKIRASKGIPTLTTVGWREKPQLNQDTHTVSWSIDGVGSDGEKIINAVALKLGRYGFERIVWIIDPADIREKNDLLLAESNHKFNDGARYTDYVASTDHAAEYGIAGLVAGALGVKLLKAAGIGALLLGLKKFAFLLILPFIFAWRKIIGVFRAPRLRG